VKSGTTVGHCAHLTGNTEIGNNCDIFSHAVVGSQPQDLKYKGEESSLKVGDNNTIREFVTINPGTEAGTTTVVGSNNLIMAYSHVAHDCCVGDYNVFANAATLAGHVQIGDRVVIGGLTAIHQFCRIGDYAMLGGCSKVVQDVPPYALADGHPVKIRGLNLTGLRRGRISRESIKILKQAFKIIFFENRSLAQAKDIIKEKFSGVAEVDTVIDFISSSKRGISR
jgi:UDP-N-acetylglucosamine acyltransferase